MAEELLLSVIIPTCHRNELLARCLDCLSLEKQGLPVGSYEVIVTDDGLETNSKEILARCYPDVCWVPGPHQGPAANRNNGARHARGKWLVFTDDDCLPDPGWLAAYGDAASASVLAMEGAVYAVGDLNRDLAQCPVNLDGGYFWSANIAIRRDLFEQLGGFDPLYPFADHEDEDLKMRVAEIAQILFVPAARVGHPVRVLALSEALRQIPRRTGSWVHHLYKHREIMNCQRDIDFIGNWSFYWLREMIYRAVRLHFKAAFVALVTALSGPILIPRSLSIERKIPGS